ncbi:MAG: RNA-guided pseudouridylation complex pseudouridine synthase subunit Cbf5 [Methanobrevibacter sp.]|jgi:H/ACA ribonucleoprotein complex subunit 4|nr:RNA-guided pseudouridylation complex pseudouridine synthase subunit Cbf5 [Candidatus Methanoflexus mossambicus]
MENLVVISKSSKISTNPDYGCIPEDRPIEEYLSKGVINLDKPSGPTSHEIDSWVKRILNVEKTGHGGTLDPKVTGVLPIGIDDATRVIQLTLSAPKEYVCLMNLHSPVSEEKIKAIFNEFQGKIYQTPPLKSAVKRELRVRTIYYSTIYEISGRDVLFKIGCEAGTYVRTYCKDIGEALGVGAHMAELRRTYVGSFSEKENLHTLQDLTDAYYYWNNDGDESYLREVVMPMEKAAQHLSKVVIKDSAVEAICHGADLSIGGIVALSEDIKHGQVVAIYTLKDELVASAIAMLNFNEIILKSSGIVFNTNKVFMKTGSYPILWKQSND